ncbi:hypothetical protein [Absidia glauca]|uniref:Secreted protein n=1 Tax=Absidia glauca TaxID=4829 RepID=A0A168SSL1_ABSGL|nr:hypothetical protein [Absidia glauca]
MLALSGDPLMVVLVVLIFPCLSLVDADLQMWSIVDLSFADLCHRCHDLEVRRSGWITLYTTALGLSDSGNSVPP